MWANELHKSYAKKDGVAEAELQNLDTGTAERLGEELRRLVLAKAAVVRGGQLVDAFANAAAKPDAPAKRKLSVLENALTVLKAPKADDRARRRKVSSVKSSAARGPAASKKGKASTLSKIKPEQRILEHPDQGFIVDPNDKSMLYCQPCKASYGTTNQAVRQHLASDKHKENLDKWQSKEPERNLLLEVLESHRNEGSLASGAIAGGGRGPSLSLASIEFPRTSPSRSTATRISRSSSLRTRRKFRSSTPCSRTAPWSLRRVQARSASSRCSATRLATSRRAPSRTTSRRR